MQNKFHNNAKHLQRKEAIICEKFEEVIQFHAEYISGCILCYSPSSMPTQASRLYYSFVIVTVVDNASLAREIHI